mmetsp:Transcript_3077/g.2056  ORF Transcript_3077/g.2056 Transcript_3077/m.2056 type:complete len:81 (+) Transcript_3077:1680-1922(+)|eukprot:CAMPEP_0116871636 /NCGR_PEP_ID=MMETSP0463-20121206/2085_1 /TAXON_ID=181622 /ORGANISM="Strombidinopsis sp, Strain SopsisLIS2011" /LENGTH=80 /DNA_ID=CAMNT_0004510453 /DNA_START=1604 /DNA_END=1846 /DNA_ORIENTATION=+
MTKKEKKRLLDMLPDLYQHFIEYPKSLICRTYGVFSVKMQGFKSVDLMIIANTLRWDDPNSISRVYDLKGSTELRKVEID